MVSAVLLVSLLACGADTVLSGGRDEPIDGTVRDTVRGPARDTVRDTVPDPGRDSTATSTLPLPADSPAELPRDSVIVPTADGAGQVRRVRAGGSLQATVDAASYGDVILLEPGARFTGPLQLRRKPGTGWITIRTDAVPTAPGKRVSLADTTRFARIEAPASGNISAITTEAGAAGYRLVNLDIARSSASAALTALVALGDAGPAQSSLAAVPTRLVFDRVIIRGRPGLTLRRCVALNAAHIAIVNSAVVECHEKGADSQAIAGWNGPGPFLIRNNLLEGAGENVMFGGADPQIRDLNPSDITIEGNHFRKPASWFASKAWTAKNLLELKQGKRVLIRGNLFENNWLDGQAGYAILFKSVNQDGRAPWAETSDITFVENVIRNTSSAISLAARPEVHPAIPMSRLLIARNVIHRVGGESDFPPSAQRALLLVGGIANVHIDDNTISAPASVIYVARDGDPPRVPGFSFRRNVARFGLYGIHGGGAGRATFEASYTTVSFAGNCLFGAPSSSASGYASGALLSVADESTVLPGLSAGNYALAADSPCRTAAGGAVPGAPAEPLRTWVKRVESGH